MGGKNPVIIFKDCDFKSTIKGVLKSSFTNQGRFVSAVQGFLSRIQYLKNFEFCKAISIFYIDIAKKENGRILLGEDQKN